jgi:carboxylate-amine ligase
MLEFKPSEPLTLGVELELQLVNTRDYNLTRGASDLLGAVAKVRHPGEIKPEITESMIEICTTVCRGHAQVRAELDAIRQVIANAAAKLNLGVAGGGTHPFQKWSERRIYDTPRFRRVSELYGYLAKQFTVFGQHIHVGVRTGDEAVRLIHGLARYVPHFIALSASSPFSLGADTQFDSSRLNVVNAFPLAGFMPYVRDWEEFEAYFGEMRAFGIVESMKDFYWDIRPKPEYGTVEIRVCDTPLTVEKAAALAAYAQALGRYLLVERVHPLNEDFYLPYDYNRFQACRFGFDGELIDPVTRAKRSIGEDIAATLETAAVHARELEGEEGLAALAECVRGAGNDARWMRETYARSESLPDLVYRQAQRWRGAAR